jgi:hypothetical protein
MLRGEQVVAVVVCPRATAAIPAIASKIALRIMYRGWWIGIAGY